MTDLTKIFPQNYPDLPTWKDIQVIFNDLLNRSDSVDDIVSRIDKEACPSSECACEKEIRSAHFARRHSYLAGARTIVSSSILEATSFSDDF